MKVLIVDDDRGSADGLVALLTGLGHDVRVEADAGAGAAAAIAWLPDLALLDIGLPEGAALQMARRLRDATATRAIRLVALNDWGQREDRRRSTMAGFDHHLVKPIDPLHLRVLLNAVAARTAAEANRSPAT